MAHRIVGQFGVSTTILPEDEQDTVVSDVHCANEGCSWNGFVMLPLEADFEAKLAHMNLLSEQAKEECPIR